MNLVIPNSMVTPSYAMGYARSQSESANPGLWADGAWIPAMGLTGKTLFNVAGAVGHNLDVSAYGDWRMTSNGPAYHDWATTGFGEQIFNTSNPKHSIVVRFKVSNVGEAGVLQQYTTGVTGRMEFYVSGSNGARYGQAITFSPNKTVALGDIITVGVNHHKNNGEIFWNGVSANTTTSLYNGMVATETKTHNARDTEIIALYIFNNRILTAGQHLEIANDIFLPVRRKDQTIYIPSATAGFNRRYYDAFIARSA